MIVDRTSPSDRPGELMIVTQNDHAALSSDLLALFPSLRDHPQRPALLRAARLHDIGWAELDSAPLIDEEGRPLDFLSLPVAERIDIWQRAIGRLRKEPLVAALVAEHALFLLARSEADRAALAPVSAWLEDTLVELLEAGTASKQEIVSWHGWIRVADALSLVACGAWKTAQRIAGVAGVLPDLTADRPVRDRLVIEPLPLVGASRVTLRYRVIPERRYTSTSDVVAELAVSTWRELSVRVTGSAIAG